MSSSSVALTLIALPAFIVPPADDVTLDATDSTVTAPPTPTAPAATPPVMRSISTSSYALTLTDPVVAVT